MRTKIEESIFKEIEKEPNEKTTVQIRLYDDRTGMAFYKYLTQKELCQIIGTFEKMQWQ
jgi:hypothetical protein